MKATFNKLLISLLVLSLLLVQANTGILIAYAEEPQSNNPVSGIVPGEIIVKYKEGTAGAVKRALLKICDSGGFR
jgi:hypothetical protein